MAKFILGDSIVLPKAAGNGVMLNQTTPQYAWRDIIGEINPKASGAGSPTRAIWRGNQGAYSFALNDVTDFCFHIPHDFVPTSVESSSHLYWHLHWGHNGTDVSGTFEVTNYVSYAKGHNQANFPAEVAPTISYATTNIATTPQYRHRIDEIQLSASSPTATQIDSDDIEPDGLLLITSKLTGLPTVTGGNIFIFYGDLHYLSSNVGTTQRSPNPTFWS